MSYSTLTDLKKILPEESLIQLTDDDNVGTVNEGRVTEAISQADGEIDAYIGGRYSVPLSTVPAIIRRCSCDISVYILYKRRVEVIPETRATSYKDAIRVLEQIRDGKMPLPTISEGSSDFGFGVMESSHFEG